MTAVVPASPLRPFRAAIFDMDGLLIDSERPILDAWLAASREFGRPIERACYLQAVGRNAADGRAALRAALGDAFPFDEIRARVQVLLAEVRAREGFPVKDGALELLAALKAAKLPCAVASSTPREEVARRLMLTGLAPFFSAVVGGDEVARGKPAPDIFVAAAARLGCAPADCVVFEDAEHGAFGAVEAGMQAVIVPDLKHPGDEVRRVCLAVLDSLHDVHRTHFPHWFGAGGR